MCFRTSSAVSVHAREVVLWFPNKFKFESIRLGECIASILKYVCVVYRRQPFHIQITSQTTFAENSSMQNGSHKQPTPYYTCGAKGSFYIVNVVILDCVHYIVFAMFASTSSPTNPRLTVGSKKPVVRWFGASTLTLVTRMHTDWLNENDNYI